MEKIIQITLPTPFPVGDVHTYLIKGDALTLIDAGAKTEEAWEIFKQKLASYGYQPSDIEQIVLTHHHPDHVGLLHYLDEEIPVYGHWKNEPWITQDERFLKRNEQFFKGLYQQLGIAEHLFPMERLQAPFRFYPKRPLTVKVKEGDRIDGLADFSVVETPGHAGSHIVFYRERDGLLIAGDHLLASISPNPLIEAPYEDGEVRVKSQLEYNRSLTKLLSYEISRVRGGHGEEILDAHSLIHERLEKQRERALFVLQMLQQKPMTAFEISQALFPHLYQKQLPLTISETLAQLDYLEELGEIRIDRSSQPSLLYYA